ncbi:GNAT family N-acetyltransferase [Vineibacter terrae]|uniref:GNAT family N-acetyltransferase n=1 Tax=Vineibacter terrae TaxID=2586908 RepID=UPI002E338A6F|nr:GNAT family N-acetyltransferase [Vineibacter terrae]HEX2891088.1 GNAT family N-acetyltransferase [Vineibacter terrae]
MTYPVVAHLEREPLRNIVLLKHLEAFPDDTTLHHMSGPQGMAALVLLRVAASAYDLRTYPTAELAALVASDHPDLTRALLAQVPTDAGVVFKLPSDADRDVVAARFTLQRCTSVLSFTAATPFARDAQVRVTAAPDAAVHALFEAQNHGRAWLEPLLRAGRAFACVLEQDGQTQAVCFAFENYRHVWEIGGLFTLPDWRGRGLAARVTRTAIAELQARHLVPRYQVHDDNRASIRVAQSIGLQRFLTITHFLHTPGTPEERQRR